MSDDVRFRFYMCDRWADRDRDAVKGSCSRCRRVIALPKGVVVDRPTLCPVCVARIVPHAAEVVRGVEDVGDTSV